MGVLGKVSRGVGVAGAGLALLMMAAPAQAALGDTVAAVVSGNVGRTAVTCTPFAPGDPVPSLPSFGHTIANFSQVQIAGAWDAISSPATPYVGTVGVTTVTACVSQIDPAVGLVNQGTLGGATYNGTSAVGGKLTGALRSGGQFVQAGTVAVALITTDYCIGTGCTSATSGGALGSTPMLAVIGVVPLASIGVGTNDIVAGTVNSY